MTYSSTFNIFRMAQVTFVTFLIGDAIFRWSGYSYYMTFREFVPNLAMMILIFTTLAAIATGILKAIEVSARTLTKRLGISIDFGIVYAWCFLVVFSVVTVKYFKLWMDSFIYVPYWNIFRLLIFFIILFGASALAWWKREKLITSVIGRLKPVFWLFFLMSAGSILVVSYHSLQTGRQDFPAPVHAPKVPPSKPNIILVIMDALTARNMSVYGYERKTTPFLEEFAGESHLFTRFYANCNFTTPSVVSMLTSKYPWSHQTYQFNATIREDIRSENLARMLRENGYTTMAFVANRAANPFQLGIARDFDSIVPAYKLWSPYTISSYIEFIGSRVLDHGFYISRAWLKIYIDKIFSWDDTSDSEFPMRLAFDSFFDHISAIRQPFFACIHVMPPHSPYLPPEPYRNTFASEGKMSSIRAQWGFWGPYPPSQQGLIDSLRKRYDEFILYCDAEFRDFVNRLKETGLYDQSLLILSSDHGEMFEKGYFAHSGPYLYEPLVHIPMMIHEPGQAEGTQIDALSDFTDIAPTLLDYVGIPIPEWMEGESLLPALRGRTNSARPKFTMWFRKNRSLNHPITTGTIAVLEDDFKLIHYIKDSRSELYNLRLDPREDNDLINTEAQIAQRLKFIILERIRQVNATREE